MDFPVSTISSFTIPSPSILIEREYFLFSKFAVIDIDAEGYLNKIIEKPDPETVEMFRD